MMYYMYQVVQVAVRCVIAMPRSHEAFPGCLFRVFLHQKYPDLY